MPDNSRKETIPREADAEFIHRKVLNGGGEFAGVRILLEPLPRGAGVQYANETIPGVIPRQWLAAVEERIREASKSGVLNGGPVVDFRATLIDGRYHDIDSNPRTFFIAAQGAFRAAMLKAEPILL